MNIRLHKYLANLGVDSRRKCEEYILQGLVQVNGKIIKKLGTCIDPNRDKIIFNHKLIKQRKNKYKTLMLNKPRGYVCTTKKTEGRTVFELLKGINERLSTIGRLDKKSEGLLLLSNDGELVYQLSHPSFKHKKIYHVVVSGQSLTPTHDTIKKLNTRLIIDGYLIQKPKVKYLRPGKIKGRYLLEFELIEGRKRQIRKMCELVHLNIHRLKRMQINNLFMKGLKPGQWRILNQKELSLLKNNKD